MKINISTVLLCLLSIFIGFLSKDIFIGFGTDFWGSSIWVNPVNYLLLDIEFLNSNYKSIPFFITVLGFLIAFFAYNNYIYNFFSLKKTKTFTNFYAFFNKKWFFDRIYTEFITQKFVDFSLNFCYKQLDRGLFEKIGPTGIVEKILFIVNITNKIQSGFVLHYLFCFTIILFIAFIFVF